MTENKNIDESNHEIIDIEIYTNEGKHPPIGKHYKVKIDGEYYIFHHHIVTGKDILEKACKTPVECHSLYQKFKDCDFNKISLDEKVDLAKHGIEHFVVKPPEVFYYTVDGESETTEHKSLTANQILELAGLKPADYYLVLVHSDGRQDSYKDKPHEEIKMKCPGLKFISVFRGEVPVSCNNHLVWEN
jgi:hypothetical protein